MPSKQAVADFIQSTFRSVWALELLCFLRQHQDRSLTHAQIVAGLRGSDLVVTQSLESLAAAGLVVTDEDGSTRFAPASRELVKLVDGAEAFYRSSPNAVRRMIVAGANPSITAFADAFRLRKD